MTKIYDWENNTIKFEDKYKNKFNLQLRGQIKVVMGESASGKTLLCNRISRFQKEDKKESMGSLDASNIFIMNTDNMDKLDKQEHKLIIIDRADTCLKPDDIAVINRDTKNRYLVCFREPIGIEVAPNHFAEIQNINKEITLKYDFNW